jgi:hypothetical protein
MTKVKNRAIMLNSNCGCLPPITNKRFYTWRQSEKQRVSAKLNSAVTSGGKVTFGNKNRMAVLNAFGGWEGQPGGSVPPLRNQF